MRRSGLETIHDHLTRKVALLEMVMVESTQGVEAEQIKISLREARTLILMLEGALNYKAGR